MADNIDWKDKLRGNQEWRGRVQKWLDKLRDPETRQARGLLMDGSGAGCCLGWLCEVAEVESRMELNDQVLRGFEPRNMKAYGKAGSTVLLPGEAMDWIWSPVDNPLVRVAGGEQDREYLSWLNDEVRLTLAEIADLVEADWLDDAPIPIPSVDAPRSGVFEPLAD
jgi:hypothetical protein